jgi:hypothetical protein
MALDPAKARKIIGMGLNNMMEIGERVGELTICSIRANVTGPYIGADKGKPCRFKWQYRVRYSWVVPGI